MKNHSESSHNMNNPAPFVSSRTGWKAFAVLFGGLLLLAVLSFASLTRGLSHLSIATVLEAIVSPQAIPEHQIINGVRLPRTVMGLLSGAALAVAGALMQSVTRNPLASETTLGVNAGAYLMVVLGTIFFPGLLHRYAFPLAVAGGVVASLAVFGIGGGKKGTPIRITLAGMIVTLVLSSVTNALMLLFEESTQGLFIWGSGSLMQNDWSGVLFSWPWIVSGLIVVMLAVRRLDLLAFSEETARSLGGNVSLTRLLAMAIAIVLACISVSIVGPIGFIGLIAPHIVKLSGITKHVWLLPISALWGAAILIGADTIARSFAGSVIGDLPAGAITALIGAPWIIWLALRASRSFSSSSQSSLNVGTLLRKPPYRLLLAIFSIIMVSVCLMSLRFGSISMSLQDVMAGLVDWAGNGSSVNGKLIGQRIPRMLTALLAGIAFAASGSLLQSSLRNPLADPHIVGISGGAGVGALALIVVVSQLPATWITFGAFIGGVAAASLVYLLAWKRGFNPMVLVLIGVAIASACSAIINMLVIHAKLTLAPALAWLAGSTYARGWNECLHMLPFIVVLIPLGWWLGRRVDLLSFHDHSAQGVGLPVQHTRALVGLIAVLLASSATAAVGTIGFIGLLAPHAARMLVGSNHRRSMILAIMLGGTLLVGADLIGRLLLAPKEVPSGIVVALLGAPYLFYLMIRSSRSNGS